ncbi:3-dehydroquinate dehydratase [Polaromonas sp. CG_9.11]|nr:3-dehydroquinate dehydratase [Polaromonas sp. CG_9.11]
MKNSEPELRADYFLSTFGAVTATGLSKRVDGPLSRDDKLDPKQFGTITLDEINAGLSTLAQELGATIEAFQTKSEGAMCERIHQGYADGLGAVLINAGA